MPVYCGGDPDWRRNILPPEVEFRVGDRVF